MKLVKSGLVVFCSFFLLTSCAGRVPSAKTAQNVAKGYFKSYGNKFEPTPYSGKNVDTVLINNIYELHFQTALVDSNVVLKSGGAKRVLVTMRKRFPAGWRVISWENLSTGEE